MNCITPDCPNRAEWLDLCQECWEAQCNLTWWERWLDGRIV